MLEARQPFTQSFDLLCADDEWSGHGVCPSRLAWWLNKMKGLENIPPNSVAPPWRHSFISLFQATLSISFLAYFSTYWTKHEDRVLIVASFGASAVLVHSAIKSPLSQPRNLLMGNVVSAITGVTIYKVISLDVALCRV